MALFLTKFLDQPLFRLATALAVVAAILPVAKRDDIRWNSTWAIWVAEWYPVIKRYGVKQAIKRPTAYCAFTFKVAYCEIPVIFGEISREIDIQRTRNMIVNQFHCAIAFMPSIHVVLHILGIVRFPLAGSFKDKFAITTTVVCGSFQSVFSGAFWMSFRPILSIARMALTAITAQSILGTLTCIEVLACRRKQIAAFGTSFHRCVHASIITSGGIA